MTIKQINQFVEKFATMCKHEFSAHELKNNFPSDVDITHTDYRALIDEVIKNSNKISLTIIESSINKNDFENFINTLDYPFASVIQHRKKVIPVIVHKLQNEWMATYWENDDFFTVEISTIKPELQCNPSQPDEIIVLSPLSLNSMVSSEKDDFQDGQLTPVQRLFKLLKNEKQDIGYIYIYAIAVGLISLSLPLGIQAIISLISGGQMANNVVLLISLVIVGTLISGGLQVMQISLVETLQRRVFAKAAFEFTYRIPKVKMESILKVYPPELMNRFFDILQVQKGLPKLLIDLSAAALQILFGLMLLAFYHPFFIVFGLVLIGFLIIIFYNSGPKGLKSSLIESKYKYKIAHWLEEMARTLTSFKLAGFTNLPLQKMDYYLNGYLKARKGHFKVLLSQFYNIIIFKTVVIGGLLILGCVLITEKQITLGQFVASEIVIILIIGAVEKFILGLDIIYDLLTAVEKIGHVTDLPLEKNAGVILDRNYAENGVELKVQNLKYKYPEAKNYTLNGVTFSMKSGENVCIAGFNGAGKNTISQILSGILEGYEGVITLNNLSIRDINLNSLRDVVGKYNSKEDIFDGTIFENISMGIARTTIQDVMWAIEQVNLNEWIHSLPNGLNTELIAGGKGVNTSVIKKIILARAIAEKPNLLIATDFLSGYEKTEKLRLINLLLSKQHGWSTLCVSNDPALMSHVDKIILIEKGIVVASGTFEELKNNQLFKQIITE